MMIETFILSLVLLGWIAPENPTLPDVEELNCNYTDLGSKEGTVYGKTTGTMMPKQPACKNTARVTFAKRGGKAKAMVYVYLQSTMRGKGQLVATHEFPRNAPNSIKTFSLNNTMGKCVRVEVKNKSVGDTFKYSVQATQAPNRPQVRKKK